MKNKLALISVIVVLISVSSVFLLANQTNQEKATAVTTQEPTSSEEDILNYIGTILASFEQTPAAEYYDPSSEIDKKSADYKYLINNPDLTAKYIFDRFLETRRFYIPSNEMAKEEHIMGAVLKDILGSEALKDTDYASGDYFDKFWTNSIKLFLLNDENIMKENYKYGYLLIQLSREKMIDLSLDTNRADEIDRRIYLFDSISSDEKNISITDIISCVTDSDYIGSVGSEITIHKFSYSDSLKFNVNVADDKIVCATYYICGKEYAYNGAHGYTVSENTNNVDNSDDIKLVANDGKLKNLVASELKKSKYKDYVTKFDESDIDAIWCYRLNVSDYTFIYDTNVDYSYVFGFRINDDDSKYNDCKVAVNAQTGQIMAVYFTNYYDNV